MAPAFASAASRPKLGRTEGSNEAEPGAARRSFIHADSVGGRTNNHGVGLRANGDENTSAWRRFFLQGRARLAARHAIVTSRSWLLG